MKKLFIWTIAVICQISHLSAQEPFNRIPSAHSWKSNDVLVLSRAEPQNRRIYFEYDIRKETMKQIELTAPPKNSPTVAIKDGEIYYYNISDSEKRLTNTSSDEKNPTLSPDFKRVAFTRDNDLYSLDVETLIETRHTFDGSDLILNGWASWVYYEEILGRSTNYKAFWWSPDSKRIAFYRFDDSNVPMFPIYHSTGQHGFLNETRYPKAGDPNPEVKLGFADIEGGAVVWADFNEKDDQYFGTPFCGDSSADILVQWMNRDQNILILYAVDILSGHKKEIYKEQQKTWIDWIEDVTHGERGFYFVRDFELWEHIYYQSYDGGTLERLTDGMNWGVRIVSLDENKKSLIFTARRETSERTDIYRLMWNNRGKTIKRLSSGDLNYSNPLLSPDGKHFVTTASNVATPNKLLLFPVEKGGVVKEGEFRTIADSRGEGFGSIALPVTEMMFITTSEGFRLPGTITYPTHFDKSKKYPVIVSIYGGPNSTNVMDRWREPSGNMKMWADEGVIQVSVDNRASGHCGKEAINYIHRNLGYWEIHDFNLWGEYLASLPYVDKEKIGITGFSYGGTMTATALTDGAEYFSYGIAGGGVYNWLLYDSHYTERYMDHPQDNIEGYEQSAVIRKAEKYTPEKGSLLLLTHGTGDDNVHYQNTLQLITEFQRENKHFELMIYPEAMHGYRGFQGIFSNEQIVRFWKRTLLGK